MRCSGAPRDESSEDFGLWQRHPANLLASLTDSSPRKSPMSSLPVQSAHDCPAGRQAGSQPVGMWRRGRFLSVHRDGSQCWVVHIRPIAWTRCPGPASLCSHGRASVVADRLERLDVRCVVDGRLDVRGPATPCVDGRGDGPPPPSTLGVAVGSRCRIEQWIKQFVWRNFAQVSSCPCSSAYPPDPNG